MSVIRPFTVSKSATGFGLAAGMSQWGDLIIVLLPIRDACVHDAISSYLDRGNTSSGRVFDSFANAVYEISYIGLVNVSIRGFFGQKSNYSN
ncbi:hypothetical protein BP00DRAFT_199621 [Aspergillus indologenus CBS 114.80]|uniref:Uncharacterized protein n=1 Tax=Aspergillus indologenus CBS 114.80 TaxID=1450541 RepID=A0A2V5I950_9EURO|nr:hypothetical protein BP00DRAFT_199621 [Aspergillus indologenus CBS 114.80]